MIKFRLGLRIIYQPQSHLDYAKARASWRHAGMPLAFVDLDLTVDDLLAASYQLNDNLSILEG